MGYFRHSIPAPIIVDCCVCIMVLRLICHYDRDVLDGASVVDRRLWPDVYWWASGHKKNFLGGEVDRLLVVPPA